jgi:hypothetical protein
VVRCRACAGRALRRRACPGNLVPRGACSDSVVARGACTGRAVGRGVRVVRALRCRAQVGRAVRRGCGARRTSGLTITRSLARCACGCPASRRPRRLGSCTITVRRRGAAARTGGTRQHDVPAGGRGTWRNELVWRSRLTRLGLGRNVQRRRAGQGRLMLRRLGFTADAWASRIGRPTRRCGNPVRSGDDRRHRRGAVLAVRGHGVASGEKFSERLLDQGREHIDVRHRVTVGVQAVVHPAVVGRQADRNRLPLSERHHGVDLGGPRTIKIKGILRPRHVGDHEIE